MIKKVYVISKTHLDIGFTDLAENVVNTYIYEYLPNVVKTCNELKDTDTPYAWTVSPWVLTEALKKDDGTLEKAIKDGLISWHAMPFTPFSESMNPELLEYALSISENLDKRFGKKTTAVKFSDVPGTSRALIKPLCNHGIKFIHMGINRAFRLKDLPNLFRWKNGDDEIVVAYNLAYGTSLDFDDFAVYIDMRGDNTQGLPKEVVIELYDMLRKKYPGADVSFSNMSEVAEKIVALKDTFPVVEDEIGDMWSHNISTDPMKVSLYKELLRHIEKNGINGDITNNLMLIPEHTWGCCIKRYFTNYTDYSVEALETVRNSPSRKFVERSWEEKREYIDEAQKALGTNFVYDVKEPDLDGFNEIPVFETNFEFSWQLYDTKDYAPFVQRRVDTLREDLNGEFNPYIYIGGILDNCKWNLPKYQGGIYIPNAVAAFQKGDVKVIKYEFEENLKKEHGLPYVYAIIDGDMVEFRWFGMKPNRLPQSYWVKFKGFEENWEIRKIGQWFDVDARCNPLFMGSDYGVRNSEVEIENIDSLLVAPYGRRLLDVDFDDKKQDLYFNIYNNIWGCNHPMWYSDDSKFRFRIKKR